MILTKERLKLKNLQLKIDKRNMIHKITKKRFKLCLLRTLLIFQSQIVRLNLKEWWESEIDEVCKIKQK